MNRDDNIKVAQTQYWTPLLSVDLKNIFARTERKIPLRSILEIEFAQNTSNLIKITNENFKKFVEGGKRLLIFQHNKSPLKNRSESGNCESYTVIQDK